MRPLGTSAQLAARRARAATLLHQGYTTIQVANVVGVTPRSVQRWQRATLQRSTRRTPARPPHRPCRLTPRQLKRLEQILLRGAGAYGYAEDYWTLARIAQVIVRQFGIQYTSSAVWYLLHRMDWSCQKPQRVSFQHDEAVIARWKRYTWPRIKKVA
jgi:transposase